MSKDSRFRTIAGADDFSGANRNEPDVHLGLELITQFQLLSHENRLEVMQLVNQLASAQQPDRT
jgi:hypothetical protein